MSFLMACISTNTMLFFSFMYLSINVVVVVVIVVVVAVVVAAVVFVVLVVVVSVVFVFVVVVVVVLLNAWGLLRKDHSNSNLPHRPSRFSSAGQSMGDESVLWGWIPRWISWGFRRLRCRN